MESNSWRSYPKIYALGHKQAIGLTDHPVIVQEKVDGSQFSFGVIDCRTKKIVQDGIREVHMEPQTNTANTQNWLDVSRGIKIRAFIEAFTPTLNIWEGPVPYENFDTLKEISVLLPAERVPTIGSQLDVEFQAWDVLSDEALRNFEQELD